MVHHVSAPMFHLRCAGGSGWRSGGAFSGSFATPVEVKAAHPDRAGGLGFLGEGVYGFMPVLFAQGVVVSGLIASRVLTGASTAIEFRAEIALMVVLLIAQVLIPMLFFVPALIAARREGLRRYGALAATYVRDFERKWLGANLPTDEALVGSADIQSLADMAGSRTWSARCGLCRLTYGIGATGRDLGGAVPAAGADRIPLTDLLQP